MTNIYASHIWKSCQRATCPHTREHVVCARCVKLRAVASRRSVSTRFAKPVLFPYPRTELLAQFIFLLLFFTLERKGRKMNHARSLVLGYGNRTGLRFMSRRSARNVATFRIRVSSINQLVNCGFDIVQCTRDHEIDSYLLFFWSISFFSSEKINYSKLFYAFFENRNIYHLSLKRARKMIMFSLNNNKR